MPHTNQKKKRSNGRAHADPQKKFSHSKREYIPSDDGWIQVADKRRQDFQNVHKPLLENESPSIDMTLEEMAQEFERYKKQWESSDACAQLQSLLATKNEDTYTVENTVCLGLGSLQALSLEWRRTSHTQLAALTTIKGTLSVYNVHP
jgi:hypothetical protein